MSKHSDLVLLRHMLAAGERVQQYINGLTKDDFFARPMVQDAVARQLEIMGEAANHLSPSFCEVHGQVPWKYVAGMRHRLIHGYFDVDWLIVWETATTDVPGLLEKIRSILSSCTEGES